MAEGVALIQKYFPNLSEKQIEQFSQLGDLYKEWNDKINVVSRKDIEELYERHILHSLGIAKVMQFQSGSKILDVGTGGGFPGLPLAILFPECSFHLVDSIGKKIKVVEGVAEAIGLTNLTAEHTRAEKVNDKFDFVVSRAVTRLAPFMNWIRGKFLKENINELTNGVLYLKGGNLTEELMEVKYFTKEYELPHYFDEPFFETKKVVYVKV